MKYTIVIVIFLFSLSNALWAKNVLYVTNYEEGFKNWKIREFKGKADYFVKISPKNVITLKSEKTSFSLSRELVVDLKKFPFLNFEWLVEKLPSKGDLRDKLLDDQAAQIYVIIQSFPEFVNYKAIGYVWETTAPLGVYQSKKFKNIKYVVIRTGEDGLKKWHVEKRNIYEDFRKIWNMELGNEKLVITIGIDSDDTKSSALSSFGNIYFSEE